MASLRFDGAAISDLDVVLDMARRFHAEDGHPLTEAGAAALARILAGEPLARCWLMREGGVAIGYLVITLGYSIEHGGRDGFIDDLFLIPEARARGLGALALDFACREAAALGIAVLHLDVDSANERAHRLYRASGFAETGRQLMSKRLKA